MKRRMGASYLLCTMLAASMLLAACGARSDVGSEPDAVTAAGNEQATNEQQPAQPQEQEADQPLPDKANVGEEAPQDAIEETKTPVNVYFTDEEQTGLSERTRELVLPANDSKSKVEAAFKALQQDGDNGEVSLWKHAELLSIAVDGQAVTLDIHLPDEARFGAPGEALAIESLTKTLFQFDDVDAIDILIDGEKADSLMGHEMLDHPIVKP
ncbi:GerMN domain-containing protein [Paenibacillus methanolicus]|uniref:Sporulation and spore germination protein n=1 Tax=Paenibacillus methanolicus TaxID=582686 RepID=A0A5S5C2D5_9BACL|nr:GerMN domain-containing protein [Paenibacillus methanolicus]TYP72632.1 sporulation and spore germination protein [Paenibacillus methanolicus]